MRSAELVDGRVVCTGTPAEPPGVRCTRSADAVELHRERPSSTPLYFRVGPGRLQWGTDLAAFFPDGAPPAPGAGDLLALLNGQVRPPESTVAPGVRRLMLGGTVRLDASGATATRRTATPDAPPPGRLADAVHAVLDAMPAGYAVAYSGGLGSAFVAAVALRAGHRPALLHAGLALPGRRPPAEVPGLTVQTVRVDLDELFDHHPLTGDEPAPVLPDIEVRRRLTAAIRAGRDLPLVGGGLLEDLTAVKLPDIDAGLRARRLLACEPFHISGTLRRLATARELMGNRIVYRPGDAAAATGTPDVQQVGAPPPPSPTGGSRLPWLTPAGRQELEVAQRGSMAVWQDHLDQLDPVLGRLVAGLEERGDGGLLCLALDPRVHTAAAAIPARRLGRIRHGVFENHRPLRAVVEAAGITGVRRASSGFWLRLGAADHLRRRREKLALELHRGCALADLGVVDVRAVTHDLRDGRDLTEHALPLLRLVWIDRWLRGRS